MNYVIIKDKVIIIRLRDEVRNADGLYERTRKAWRLKKERAEGADYALSVYRGV